MSNLEEAVKAAASAIESHIGRFRETWNMDPSEFTDEARAAIEAAAPLIASEAYAIVERVKLLRDEMFRDLESPHNHVALDAVIDRLEHALGES